MGASTDVDRAVRERYSQAARQREAALCCPVEYDPRYLEVIPPEVLERDYGCGDPTPYIEPGEAVLDLGCGAGKTCFIAAQIAGPGGRVLGVDRNGEMLAVARRFAPEVARRLGFSNVEFRRSGIEDLRSDFDAIDRRLRARPVDGAEALREFEDFLEDRRLNAPLVPDESVDVVISNCVLNLVKDAAKPRVFAEAYRVLRRGGRAVVSDIVADEAVPDRLKNDPRLWSGCVSGALEQGEFLRAFEAAGFYGIEILKRDSAPWRTAEGIEFRSITVRAFKGKEGPCLDCNQAVIYRGPWRKVEDDDGHVLLRGRPMAVCEKTFRILMRAPYAAGLLAAPPLKPVRPEEAPPFDCARGAVRHPRETKGLDYRATGAGAAACCGPEGRCG